MAALPLTDNKEFYECLKEYKETKELDNPKYDLLQNRRVYERIGEIIDNMTKRLLFSPKFINYTPDWKNEMYSEAVYNCFRYLDNFKTATHHNPFGYFTQVISNSFLQVLNKEKKIRMQREIIMDKIWSEAIENEMVVEGTDVRSVD